MQTPRFPRNPRARRGRQILTSLGIVVLAVFNSGEACPDPVSAEETTVVESMTLENWGTTFVGDTAEVAIRAKSPSGSNLFVLKSVWTVGTGSIARLLVQDICGKADCATFAILAPGSTTVTATTTVGKTSSGGTPTASTSLTVVGRPARVRFVGLPAQIRVGETIKLSSQIESATGEVITSRSLALEQSALDETIARTQALG